MEELRTIDDDEARRLMLELLIAFAQYCDENGLRYFLAYGTLLGAVRHKGYIPWDNDVDVVMPRPDYDKLLGLVKEKPIADYIDCLDYREVKTFPFAKLVDNRTVLREYFYVTEESSGIYCDVFPLDGYPDDTAQQQNIIKKAKHGKNMFKFANYRFNVGKKPAIRIIKNILYPISRLFSNEKICTKLNLLCKDYDFDKSETVGNIVWGFYDKELGLKREYFDIEHGEFEGHTFNIPKNYDKVLTALYGDYMKLPPENERKVHFYDAVWK